MNDWGLTVHKSWQGESHTPNIKTRGVSSGGSGRERAKKRERETEREREREDGETKPDFIGGRRV